MTNTVKFLFETAFDGGAHGQRAAASKRSEAVYKEEDLERVRAEAHEAGRAEGLSEAAEGVESELARLLAATARELDAQAARRDAELANLRSEAAALALAVGRKLARHALDADPLREPEAIVTQVLEQIDDERRILIRVPEGLADRFSEVVDRLTVVTDFRGEVVLRGDPTMAPGDCAVEWADGGAWRNFEALEQAVLEAVEHFIAASTPKPNGNGHAHEPIRAAHAAPDAAFDGLGEDDSPADRAAAHGIEETGVGARR